jgi:predicted RNA-binding Zn-ribbon protein involved in translation (DUF1610 family)
MDGTGARGGLAENCVCPVCGIKVARKAGTLCVSINCPKCGTMMMKE